MPILCPVIHQAMRVVAASAYGISMCEPVACWAIPTQRYKVLMGTIECSGAPVAGLIRRFADIMPRHQAMRVVAASAYKISMCESYYCALNDTYTGE